MPGPCWFLLSEFSMRKAGNLCLKFKREAVLAQLAEHPLSKREVVGFRGPGGPATGCHIACNSSVNSRDASEANCFHGSATYFVIWSRSVTVSTLDSESSDRDSNPSETSQRLGSAGRDDPNPPGETELGPDFCGGRGGREFLATKLPQQSSCCFLALCPRPCQCVRMPR